MTRRKLLALSLLGALCVAVGGFLLVRALGGLGGKSYRNPFDRELAARGIRVTGPGRPATLGAGWQAEVDDGVRKTLIEMALDQGLQNTVRLSAVDALLAMEDHLVLHRAIATLMEYTRPKRAEEFPRPDGRFRSYADAKLRTAVLSSQVLTVEEKHDLIERFLGDDLARWTAIAAGADRDPRTGHRFRHPPTPESIATAKASLRMYGFESRISAEANPQAGKPAP